jgi:hypothetical protein
MPESRRETFLRDASSRDHFHVRFRSLPVWQVNNGIESGAMLLSDIRSDADDGQPRRRLSFKHAQVFSQRVFAWPVGARELLIYDRNGKPGRRIIVPELASRKDCGSECTEVIRADGQYR